MKKFNKKIKIKNFYSRAGQDGRLDEDKQTIFFLGGALIFETALLSGSKTAPDHRMNYFI